MQPIPAIIMLRAFEPHEQGRASGLFGMGVVLAPALGPSIGGLLVDPNPQPRRTPLMTLKGLFGPRRR